jgi:hypothetical protein
VRGPKTDFWLVQTVGVLVGSVGLGLALAERQGSASGELRATAVAAAASLATLDLIHVARRRIRPIYLVDAALELTLVAGHARARPKNRNQGRAAKSDPHCPPRK